MFIDILADIHIDSWINPALINQKQPMRIFIEQLLPKNNILIIAGDLGHFNEQNLIFLEVISNYYEQILLTFGNHDLYVSPKNNYLDYNIKLSSMLQESKNIKNIQFPNGSVYKINNITFGGTSCWYDGYYAKEIFKLKDNDILDMWKSTLPDYKYIRPKIDIIEKSNNEKNILKKIYIENDVIITHVCPTVPISYDTLYNTPELGLYCFNGKDILNTNFNKIWIFGHIHKKYDFMYKKVRLICNPLGYKNENTNNIIKTFKIF